MATEQGPTKDQPPKTDPQDEDLIPLDTLDRLIADHDPEFGDSMSVIAAERAGQGDNIELLDLDELLAQEAAKSFRARFKRFLVRVRVFLRGLGVRFVDFFKETLPKLLKASAVKAKAGLGVLREGLRQFGFKSRKFKILVFVFIFLCSMAGTVLYLLIARGLPEPERLFMQSMAEIAASTTEYDPAADQETYYDSVKAAQNVLIMTKLVVNLRRSTGSGANPMLAAEFYVEGNSPDVVIEIKARETEFRDIFMRTMEEFNADELETTFGKSKLQERLVREANRLVTKGRVRKVLMKTFVLKP